MIFHYTQSGLDYNIIYKQKCNVMVKYFVFHTVYRHIITRLTNTIFSVGTLFMMLGKKNNISVYNIMLCFKLIFLFNVSFCKYKKRIRVCLNNKIIMLLSSHNYYWNTKDGIRP